MIQKQVKMVRTKNLKKGAGKEFMNRNRLKTWKDFFGEEDGMGTVEIILIIVVLVGLVLIFKTQITEIVQSLFDKITSKTDRL